ncbi:MAG TPA: hypothetical protein VF606_03145, partial [Geminicoccaceae bacterium]
MSEAGTRVAEAVRRGVTRASAATAPTSAQRSGGAPIGVLDIGTSKVCCYVVRARPGGGQGAQLLGRGYQLAEGMRAGEVVDAEAAETSILAVVHEAEQQAGLTLRGLVLAVGG